MSKKLSRQLALVSTQDTTLSVIVPAFNEEHRIEMPLRRLYAYLRRLPWSFEVIVVDDGSTDNTVGVVKRLKASMTELRYVRIDNNRGKGNAVRVGMLAAGGDIRVMLDADGSIGPSQLPKLIAPLLAGESRISIGSRYVAGATTQQKQPWYRVWWSRLSNKVVRRTVVPGIRDTQCGCKAFRADAADAVFSRAVMDGWAFDLEVLGLAQRLGYSIKEVGVVWTDDARSRINPVRDAIRVIRDLFRIRRNFRSDVYGLLG